ncbi:MAG: EAL domain-containing protein [Alphaproteobacteria bacterium]|nr:EAL domain-containing protein [Alphaproteobacteria bacterium]
MTVTVDAHKTSDSLGALRQERDRFVALAFSSADILMELDPDGAIVFVAGSVEAILGMGEQDLRGRPFIDLVSVRDRAMVEEALAIAATGTRLNGLVLHMEGMLGATPPLTLLGYRLNDMGGHYFLGLRLGAQDAGAFAMPGSEGLMDSGLPDARSFARLAGEKLKEMAYEDSECELTMMRLGGIEGLRERLDGEHRKALNEAIGGALRAGAVGGELAGEIDGSNYGLIHHQDFDIAALSNRLAEIARSVDPENAGVKVGHSTLGLDSDAIRSGEAAKALGYIFAEFAKEGPEEFSLTSLSDGLASMVDSTVARIAEFRTVLNNADFAIAFQPIVDLATRKPHHFEALARFNLPSSDNASPYQAITFAEQAGLITDFDLAMCAKVFEWLDESCSQGYRHKVAVNISGSSIGSPIFVKALHRLLEQYRGHRERILFEVTESAKIKDLRKVNTALQSLRVAGHKVCLDDFGAGAAAFQYLRDLEVDVVKIDGAYVKGAFKSEKGEAFLKAMAGLCNDLGIATVAEMVEEERYVPFLKECGVDFGQGYLFGRPSLRISDFDTEQESDLLRNVPGAA